MKEKYPKSYDEILENFTDGTIKGAPRQLKSSQRREKRS